MRRKRRAIAPAGMTDARCTATMHLLAFLLFGLVVGALARLIVPGKEPGGWVISMLLGIGGAMLGGFFGRLIGMYRPGQPAGFLMSLLGAIVPVAAYHAVVVRRAPAPRASRL